MTGWSGLALGSTAGLALAVSVIAAGVSARRIGATLVALVMVPSAFVASVVAIANLDRNGEDLYTVVDSVIAGIGGLAIGLAVVVLLRALRTGSLGVVSLIAALVGISVPQMVGLALGEDPDTLALFGLLLAVGGVAVHAASLAEAGEPTEETSTEEAPTPDERPAVRPIDGAVLAGLAGLFGGIGLTLFHGTDVASGASPVPVAAAAASVSVVGFIIFTRRTPFSANPASWALVAAVISGVGAALAAIFYLDALAAGPPSTALMAAAAWPIVVLAVDMVLRREGFTRNRALGIVLSAAATALLSVSIGDGSIARSPDTGSENPADTPSESSPDGAPEPSGDG